MKQRTIRFGSYWLKVYKYCDELMIEGGMVKFKKHAQTQTTNMLAGSDSQLEKISEMGRCMTAMADDLLLMRKKKRKWFNM